jgi:hypothetical protein
MGVGAGEGPPPAILTFPGVLTLIMRYLVVGAMILRAELYDSSVTLVLSVTLALYR